MRFRMQLIVVMLLTVTLSVAAAPTPETDDQLGNAALAERIAQTAQISLMAGSVEPATLRLAANMFEAASRLAPNEPRFLRLLTEAYSQLGGPEGREGSLSSVPRYLQLVPDDLGAQMRLVKLHFDQMETADARKKYLEQLLSDTRLASEIRAQLAAQAAALSLERTETDLAKKYVEQALALMPLCPTALRIKYQQMDSSTPLLERVTTALQLLRANPALPGVMRGLASDLADAGLMDPAMYWYQQAFNLNQRMGSAFGPNAYNEYAAELVIADQLVTAASYARGLYEQDTTNSDAAFLLTLIAKRGADKDKLDSAIQVTRAAIYNRLGPISDHLNGRNTASTTRPDGNFDIDVEADARKVTQAGDPNDGLAYVTGLADLAWLEIYFNGKPADAQKYIAALRPMLTPDSVTIARLDGWSYLVGGKQDEARVKLSAVADRDPLAALGMLQLDSAMPSDQATAAARKLVMENPAGLMGATLMEALRSKVRLLPAKPEATAIKAELDKFPKDWLDFLNPSKVQNFYQIKAETERVAHPYGVPMLAHVSITNSSNYDITVGPEGAIQSDLWFDVQVKGLVTQYLPGIAFERLTQRFVLHPRDSISTTVRIDQGNLLGLLMQNLAIEHPLYFSVLTNPVTMQNGIVPGPGGYRASFSKVAVRGSSPPTNAAMTKSFELLQAGTADVKIRTLELLGYYASRMQQATDPQVQAQGAQVADIIRKSNGDPIASVRAQAALITAMTTEGDARAGIVRSMLAAPSFVERACGVTGASQLIDAGKRKDLLQPIIDSDADPLLKKLAASVIEVAELAPPTTQPTTGPAGMTLPTSMP